MKGQQPCAPLSAAFPIWQLAYDFAAYLTWLQRSFAAG
jgi:hypothetical protein